MHTYALHKFISLAFVLTAIFVSQVILGTGISQWQFALLLLVILGYMHFCVGFYYQLSALARRPEPHLQYAAFACLVLISVALTYSLFYFFSPFLAFYFNILYFLFHGLLNEQTLIKRQSGIIVPLICLLPLIIGSVTLFNASLFHPSILIASDFIYTADFADAFIIFVQEVFNIAAVLYAIVAGLVVAIVLNLYTYVRYPGLRQFSLVSLTILVAVAIFAYLFGPLTYINVYLFIVGYHFVTWSVYFFDIKRVQGPHALVHYLLIHGIVIIPLAITAVLHVEGVTVPVLTNLFRFDIYLVFGMAHITTSFLNDAWLQRLVVRSGALMSRRG